jgi:hypothetical protein
VIELNELFVVVVGDSPDWDVAYTSRSGADAAAVERKAQLAKFPSLASTPVVVYTLASAIETAVDKAYKDGEWAESDRHCEDNY